MPHEKPTPGQPVAPFIGQTRLWSNIVQMLADWESGQLNNSRQTRAGTSSVTVAVEAGGMDRDEGKLVQLNVLQQTTDSDEVADRLMRSKPMFTISDPVWHTAIDKLAILQKPIDGDGIGSVLSSRFAVAKCNMVANTNRWAFVDPDTPTQLKTSATSGMYKVLGFFEESSEDYAVVDTLTSQNLWRFELTEEANIPPATQTAKLLDLDGTNFSGTGNDINLSDPNGYLSYDTALASGGEGHCIWVGNKFQVVAAECEAP